jgi:hypothetical protein
MNLDATNFLQPTFWIKVVALIIIGAYAIFTLVVFTQIKAMTQVIRIPHAKKILLTISLINIALAVSLFLLAVVIL